MKKVLLSLFALSTVTAVPAVGHTCRDFDFIDRSEGAILMADAEKAMEAGKYRKVLRLLDDDTYMMDWRHGDKRMELVAIANIRVGRVRAGVMSLRYLLKKKKGDPYLLTRLAEGLAKTKRGKKEAIAILEELEREDLLADAEGRQVLAQLRS